jgi:hypothetical protein
MLILFEAALEPRRLCLFAAPAATLETILEGLPLTAVPFTGFPLVLASGGRGCSTISVTALGRRNMPFPIAQSKYRSPWTEPSFFPDSSWSSIPIHPPGANAVVPTNLTIACLPSKIVMIWPGRRAELSVMVGGRRRDHLTPGVLDGRGQMA